jgi:hypothetical protein
MEATTLPSLTSSKNPKAKDKDGSDNGSHDHEVAIMTDTLEWMGAMAVRATSYVLTPCSFISLC